MMKFLAQLNLPILFFVELAMFVGFFAFGMSLHLPLAVRIIIALAIPTLVAVLWGMYFAPRANHDLPQPWNALGEYALFGLGGLAYIVSGRMTIGILFIVIAFSSETISLLYPEAAAHFGEK